MALSLRQSSHLGEVERAALERSLIEFYTAPPPEYYVIAGRNAESYESGDLPFHSDLLRNRILPGHRVCEVGCGTAHLCPEVEARGASYAGFDWSEELLAGNAKRFPKARFFRVGMPLAERFDVVASLYTIEHVANPASYLESLWHLCNPGGLVAIICPDFIDGDGLPPSLYYGATPRRLSEKLKRGAIRDAVQHLVELKWAAPGWKRHARQTTPGAFWINLKPRILSGAPYSIDADAIHLSRLADLVWWLEQRGASIELTSQTMSGIDPAILRHNCYVLARKPASGDV